MHTTIGMLVALVGAIAMLAILAGISSGDFAPADDPYEAARRAYEERQAEKVAAARDAGPPAIPVKPIPVNPPTPGDPATDADDAAGGAGEARREASARLPADPGRPNGVAVDDVARYPASLLPLTRSAADVDPQGYGDLRRLLKREILPAAESVDPLALLNRFDYGHPAPASSDPPLQPTLAWYPVAGGDTGGRYRLIVGLATYAPEVLRRPSNLVFLVDISGSMQAIDKLPAAKRLIQEIADNLDSRDTVAIVSYGAQVSTVLHPTPAHEGRRIRRALAGLGGLAGGSPGSAIHRAYQVAFDGYDHRAENGIVLLTDANLDLGVPDPRALEALIAGNAARGVGFSVVTLGEDGLLHPKRRADMTAASGGTALTAESEADVTMIAESLIRPPSADIGSGVSLRVEFDPAVVASYRLVGVPERPVAGAGLSTDGIGPGAGVPNGGPVSSATTLTLVYEIEMTARSHADLGEVVLRYRSPAEDEDVERRWPIGQPVRYRDASALGPDLRFAAAVADFAHVLMAREEGRPVSFVTARSLAASSLGRDLQGQRREFVDLIGLAERAAARRR